MGDRNRERERIVGNMQDIKSVHALNVVEREIHNF